MPLEMDAGYNCPTCGELNYVGVDVAAGTRQRFTEDCPVCCRPIDFVVRVDADGNAFVESAVAQ